jgi:hypothetical protein
MNPPRDVFTPLFRRHTDEGARSVKELRQLHERVARAHRASPWGREGAVDRFTAEIAKKVLSEVEIPDPLDDKLGRFVRELLERETTIFTPPPADSNQLLSFREQAELNQHLRAQQTFLAHPTRTVETLQATIVELTLELISSLPTLRSGAFSVPLIFLMPKAVDFLDWLIRMFARKEVTEAGLFKATADQLYENICKASGVRPNEESSKPLILPSSSNLPLEERVAVYFDGTPLEALLMTPAPFTLPDEQRFAGHWVIAPPGRGKTTLLLAMLMEDFKKDAAIIVMDSKGDLIAPIRDLKALEDRYIIIDPDPEHPVAINPLDIPKTDISLAVANLEYIFSSLLESKMTPLQTVLFRSVLRALITAFPNPTLETFRDLISNGFGKYEEYIQKLPQDLQDFFYNEFNTKVYEDRKREIVWRLRLLLENDTVRSMMLAVRTRFDIGAAMDAGKVIIINNSKAVLGDQGAEFFGRFFIAQVLAAAQARSNRRPEDKKPVYFYIDECQNVIARDERTPTILDECRSQKVALILAHQRTEQITSPNVLSALANCGVRYANSDDEARNLAPRLRTTVDFLQSLDRGEFAAYVRDMTKQAISIAVTPVDFDSVEKLSSAARGAMTERMRAQYGVPPAIPKPISERAAPLNRMAKPKIKSPPAHDSGEPSEGTY